MKTRLLVSSLLLMPMLMMVASCAKHDAAPDTPPSIQYNSITKTTLANGTTKRDRVIISISYQDADGNLGESDTTRKQQLYANQSWGNYRVETLQLINGTFSTLTPGSLDKLFFPSLGTQAKFLQGTLDFSQQFYYSSSSKLVPVKFRVQLRDRNLNESNVVETDTVHIPIGQ